jgi:hypothetical protein
MRSNAARPDAGIQKSHEGPAGGLFSVWSLVTCHLSFAKDRGSIVHHSNSHAADCLPVSLSPCLSILATAPACGSRAKHFCNTPLAANEQLTSRALDASGTLQSSYGEAPRLKFCNGSVGRCKNRQQRVRSSDTDRERTYAVRANACRIWIRPCAIVHHAPEDVDAKRRGDFL